MADDTRDAKPHLTDKGRNEAERRRERQAAALRENLKRRKTQARERLGDQAPDPAADDADR